MKPCGKQFGGRRTDIKDAAGLWQSSQAAAIPCPTPRIGIFESRVRETFSRADVQSHVTLARSSLSSALSHARARESVTVGVFGWCASTSKRNNRAILFGLGAVSGHESFSRLPRRTDFRLRMSRRCAFPARHAVLLSAPPPPPAANTYRTTPWFDRDDRPDFPV